MSNVHSRLRGLTATLALLAFVGGTPPLLLAIDAVPDLSAFSWSRLSAPDDGTLALEVITVVAWIAWAVFAYSVIAAIVSHARGIRAPRLPGLAMPQLAADRLVAAAALLFVAIPATTALLSPPRAQATPAAAPLPDYHVAEAQPVAPAAPAPAVVVAPKKAEPHGTERYTVKRGDSLWKIADERLGDGTRYVELVDLNHAMLDGRPGFLLPGTVLRVPATPAAAEVVEDEYVVQPGDTLSEIAAEQLDDAAAYQAIFEASQNTAQANGVHLTDPDLIHPGWRLTIPGQHPSSAPQKPPVELPPTPPETPPEAVPPPVPATPPAPDEAVPPPTDNVDDTEDNADDDAERSWLLSGLTGTGAVLAGSLWLVLRQHRRTQLRHRRPGTILAPPPEELRDVEKSAHVTGSVIAPRIEDLDRALRSLSPSPRLLSASLSEHRITLTLAETADLPRPWTGSATTWHLELADVPVVSADASAPYPLLVSVGQAADGALILLNLEELRTVAVTGNHERGEALARHLTAELALNPWSMLVEVDTLGVGAELTDLHPGRLRIHAPGDRAFISRLVRELSADEPAQEPDQFRAVIIANTDHPDADVADLANAITGYPTRPAAALVNLGPAPTATGTDLHLSSDGHLTSPPLGLHLATAGLTSDEAKACATLVDISREAEITPVPRPTDETAVADPSGALVAHLTEPRPHGPAGDRSLLPQDAQAYADIAATTVADVDQLAPLARRDAGSAVDMADPDLDEDLARWESPIPVAPKLTLLGPVSARTMGDIKATANRRPYYIELLAYLVLHPAGATADDLAAAIGLRPKRARTDMSALRLWLGVDHTGEPYLPRARQTHEPGVTAPYRVHRVLSDLDLFRRLRTRGESRGAEGISDLVTALRLVSGEPFTDLRNGGWSWLLEGERLDHIMTSAIVDVSHVVTTHALSTGDLDLARFSAQVSLTAAPYDDIAQLDMIAVERASGHHAHADAQLRDDVLNRSDDELGPVDLPARTSAVVRDKAWTRKRVGRTG
ncbi:LysM peptidoglycan-binding domain-containing protein [Nocardioides sp. W7]|uniref:LysM peptidoglycan-binding domain-containing protein n=1 Tax=Nocardioides sp. W7 TaxID=2931390 RepID=UPI001FD62E61|nr:LysM peptidoglycan-binding domain-containing protein [Nocardioides sp. W7]